jgi:hypothetical protein
LAKGRRKNFGEDFEENEGGEKSFGENFEKNVGNFGVGRKRWPSEEASSNATDINHHRQMTQLNRPALRKYWWATHLRQLRSTFASTRKEANDNRPFEK